jgi:hypothetical protein
MEDLDVLLTMTRETVYKTEGFMPEANKLGGGLTQILRFHSVYIRGRVNYAGNSPSKWYEKGRADH